MRQQTAHLFRSTSMAVRMLDYARMLVRHLPDEIGPGEGFDAVKSAGSALTATRDEVVTACAYLVFAIKDERIAQENDAWPAGKHQVRTALAVASSYAETYEPGCVACVTA